MAGWDGVPWWTGGAAEHSDETARLLAYVASQGAEGIVGINDLQVKAQATPNGTIRVLPGACIIRNRAPGATYQSYAARLPSTDSPITVPPTTSAGGRTDLVIARVENPNVAGEPWQDPTNAADGPYIFTRVITGVPASTTDVHQVSSRAGDSAITLALITQPPSNSVITQSMITSLRDMANPRARHRTLAHSLAAAEREILQTTDAAGEVWPNYTAQTWRVDVPDWAARVQVRGEWSQVKIPPGNVTGSLWVQFGSDPTADHFTSQTVAYDTPNSTNTQRATFSVADDLAVPVSMRGTNQAVFLRGKLATMSSTAARMEVDGASSVSLTLDFVEAPAEDAS